MSKEDVMNYVMNSPANTNPNVLSSLLDGITEEAALLTEESVTTQVMSNPITGKDNPFATAPLAYSQIIDADTIQVTFEGETYICQNYSEAPEKNSFYGADVLEEGGPDFSQFPFAIISGATPEGLIRNEFATKKPGTYQIKIEVPQKDGSSANEWSTAHIEFTVNGFGNCLIYTSNLYNNELVSMENSVWNTNDTTETIGLTIPLYNNYHLLDNSCFGLVDLKNCTTSGEITQTDDGFVIRGDGAIQLKAKPEK